MKHKYPAFFHPPFINALRESKTAERMIVTPINVSVRQRAKDLYQ